MDNLESKWAGLDKWEENWGSSMERRGLDGYSWYDLSLNVNTIPCEPEIAIIVTAWYGQLKFLQKALEGYRKSGAFVILSYDNPFYPWQMKQSFNISQYLPNVNHHILANAFVMKHITADCNKRNGWFWNIRYAQGVLKSFPNIKYVYFTNGDCICEKPGGFKDLPDILKADIMAGQNNGNIVHTADVFCKVEAFNSIIDYMYNLMKNPIIGSRSPEIMLSDAIKDLKLKYQPPLKQPLDKDGTVDMYARYGQDSTWKDILGFRNAFAEYETAGNEGREMKEFGEWVDNYQDWLYWGGEEKETICRYWDTGDRRFLYMFWNRWEDSSYNRLYYPIEFYGKEAIYEPEQV